MMKIKVLILAIAAMLSLTSCGNYSGYDLPNNTATSIPVRHVVDADLLAENAESEQLSDYANPDYLIGSDNGLEVYFVDAYIGEDNKEYYKILLYNNSDSSMRADCVSIAINGVSVLPYMSKAIDVGEYLLYADSINAQQSGFMQDYGKAVEIQAEIYGISHLDNSVVACVNQRLVLDDSIELHGSEFTGQVIYNQDDFIMGIDKVVDGDNITHFIIYYENNTDDSMAVLIEKMTVGSHEIPSRTFLTAAHNSYFAWGIYMDTAIANEEYEVNIDYVIIDDIVVEVDGPEHNTLTFTLRE